MLYTTEEDGSEYCPRNSDNDASLGGKGLSGDSAWRNGWLILVRQSHWSIPSPVCFRVLFLGSLASQWKKLMFWCRHTKFFISKPKLVPQWSVVHRRRAPISLFVHLESLKLVTACIYFVFFLSVSSFITFQNQFWYWKHRKNKLWQE